MELKMMQSPDDWPMWPWLPVKQLSTNPGEWPKLFGCLFDDSRRSLSPVVYDVNAHTIKDKDEVRILKSYESFEAMVDDGWVVD